jgi:hypothetical protein
MNKKNVGMKVDDSESNQMIKDLGFALFMGTGLGSKYHNETIASRNKQIITFFSKPISEFGKDYFSLKLEENLEPKYMDLI